MLRLPALPEPVVRASLPACATAVLAVLVPAAPGSSAPLDLVVACGLLIAGSIAWSLGRLAQGLAAGLAGVALGAIAEGAPQTGSSLVRWLAVAAAPFVVPLVARTISPLGRLWLVALAGATVAGPIRALVYDPFLDAACDQCLHNRLAIGHHADFAGLLLSVGTWTTAAALVLVSHSGRHRALIAATGVLAVATLWRSDARVLAAVVAIAAVMADVLRSMDTRRRLRHLEKVVGAEGGFERSLREMLNDPGLTAAYWLDDEDRLAAADGGPAPLPSVDQISTDLRVQGRAIARVHHNPSTVGVAALAEAIDVPALIVLENERLRARLASRAMQLQLSRARIVERADSERSRLERDVHDSAQQHLLALGFDLRVALAAVDIDQRRAELELCLLETTAALDELRDLSHGLYPPSLEAGGLNAALRALGRRTTTAIVEIGALPDRRLPRRVERAVFALVAEATTMTTEEMRVDIHEEDGAIVLTLGGIGSAPTGVVADRVAAIGGTLAVRADTIVAVIPCE